MRLRWAWRPAAVLAVGACGLALVPTAGRAAASSEQFDDRLVARIGLPTSLAFTPDGRMLIGSKTGQVYVHKQGSLGSAPALDLGDRVCTNEGRGLLGLAVDPAFETPGDNYVYAFYTFNKSGVCPGQREQPAPVTRVSRFLMSGDVIDRGSEEVLIDNVAEPNAQHHGGDLRFGKDGLLYISVGDGSCDYAGDSGCGPANDSGRDPHYLGGKILRLAPDGSVPDSNPYAAHPQGADCALTGGTAPGAVCRETFASGLRNPYRMAFDPDVDQTRFRIHDVGQGDWEEVNRGEAGADYGWNCKEGPDPNAVRSSKCRPMPPGLTDPLFAYRHRGGCDAITAGAWVPNGVWGARWDGDYLFADYVCNSIFRLVPEGDGNYRRSLVVSGLAPGGPIAMEFAPWENTRALYYTTAAGGGQVRRILPTDGNRLPVARMSAPQAWSEDLEIELDGSRSSDPDGDGPLTYLWDFTGDGTIDETSVGDPTTSHTFPERGRYVTALTVRDSRGAESDATAAEVFPGDLPPQGSIDAPAQGSRFTVGDEVALHASATDPDDDEDPTLSWDIRRWHNRSHTHPYHQATGASPAPFSAPAPEDLNATSPRRNYLEIRLTATDPLGLKSRVTRILRPDAVSVAFGTRPSGLKVLVDGTAQRTPEELLLWRGQEAELFAPSQRDGRGRRWRFAKWSDDGAARHTVVIGGASPSYVAGFRRP